MPRSGVGNDYVGKMSMNYSAAGGTVITGKMELYSLSGTLLCTLIADRVKGIAAPNQNVRFQNAMIELWLN